MLVNDYMCCIQVGRSRWTEFLPTCRLSHNGKKVILAVISERWYLCLLPRSFVRLVQLCQQKQLHQLLQEIVT